MKTLKSKEGFITFLDILGYGNILENNSPEYIANEIFKILGKAKAFTQKHLPEITEFDAVKSFDYKLIDFLSLSDSILISFDLSNLNKEEKYNGLFVYFLYCSFISRMMHENGLPVRGAIDFGKYILKNSFIAGTPIIESYKLGCKIEMEGIVFTKNASKVFHELTDDQKYSTHHTACEYLVQLKDQKEEKMLILSPSPCTTPIYGELRQYILNSFWKHNKDIPENVRRKIDNTEQYLRYLKSVHTHLFAEEGKENEE
jgi:hypothetical protein